MHADDSYKVFVSIPSKFRAREETVKGSEELTRSRSGGKKGGGPERRLLRNGALSIRCRTTYRGCRCGRGPSASPARRPRPRAPLDA